MSSTCRFDGIFRAVASNVDAATIEMCEHMLSIVHELPKKYALALRAKAGSVVTRTQFCDFCNQMEANRAQFAAAPRCPTCGAATFPDGSGEFECEAFAGFCGTFASAVDAMHPHELVALDAIYPAIVSCLLHQFGLQSFEKEESYGVVRAACAQAKATLLQNQRTFRIEPPVRPSDRMRVLLLCLKDRFPQGVGRHIFSFLRLKREAYEHVRAVDAHAAFLSAWADFFD